ncbi:MAG: sortase, partial [Anaerolineaceae bacterium]|nr:sortase [Anaerolineaceae bacterium]
LSKTGVVCSGTSECVTAPTVSELESGTFALPALAPGETYQIDVTVDVTATSGSVTKEANVEAPSGMTDDNLTNNAASDTDTIDEVADLAITIDDGVTSVDAGGTTTFTIVVTNNGPSTVTGAILSDPAVSGLSKTSVVCSGTSECVTAPTVSELESGTFALPALAAGETYQIDVTVDVTATEGDVTNTASVSAPSGVTDSDESNNSASDTDTLSLISNIGIAKRVTDITKVSSGTYDVTFEFYVENYGDTQLSNIQVTDDLTAAFPAPSTFEVRSLSSSDFEVNYLPTVVVGYYDGSSFTDLLRGTDSLAVGESGTITLVVRVIPSASSGFTNTSVAEGTPPVGDPVSDDSSDGTDPDNTEDCPTCVNEDGDPTNNTKASDITFDPDLFDPPFGIKTLDASGLPLLQWTMVWIGDNNFPAMAAVSDPISFGTTFVAAGAASGTGVPTDAPDDSTDVGVSCYADPGNPASQTTTDWCYYEGPTLTYPRGRIVWEGTLGPDLNATNAAEANDELYITFDVRVADGVSSVANTATIDSDLNNDGDMDDPGEQIVASAAETWTGNRVRTRTELPATGFAPDQETFLPVQPAALAYADLSDLWLEIPALGVKMSIVGVPESLNTWNVDWLGNQAGWLEGTAYPTWKGNSVITGHVTREDGTPGPFAQLDRLNWGDEVILHAFGQRYIYQVRSSRLVTPGDHAPLAHEETPVVTLLTCNGYDVKSGSYQLRVAVKAVLLKVEAE